MSYNRRLLRLWLDKKLFAWAFGVFCGATTVDVLWRRRDDIQAVKKPPLTPSTGEELVVQPTLDMQKIDSVLRLRQRRGFVKTSNGLAVEFATNSLPSNNPMEDRQTNAMCGEDEVVFGVMDGHGGWQCAQKVSEFLPNMILRTKLLMQNKRKTKDMTNFMSSILEASFLNLDSQILSFLTKVPHLCDVNFLGDGLLAAASGCCAAVLVVNANKTIHAAHVGDCRVVVGTKSESGMWEAVALTNDQRADIESEVERLKLEHPREELTVVRRGRVLGRLQPTRSFGDGVYKYPKPIHDIIRALSRRSVTAYLTPPYVSAKPEVQSRTLTKRDVFAVIASDGLWDEINNAECVDIVGRYLDENGPDAFFGDSSKDSVVTHLIRTALGGTQQALSKTLSIPLGPASRKIRDDISVTIVKFQDVNLDGQEMDTSEGVTVAENISLEEQYNNKYNEWMKTNGALL